MDETDKHVNPNPILGANPCSRLFFWWLNPLFKLGYKQTLETTDMFNVVEDDSSVVLTNKLEKEWEVELEKTKKGGKPSLFRAMFRAFGRYYMVLGLVAFFEEATKVAQPLLLGGLIRYFTVEGGVSQKEAYLFAGGVSLCAVLLALFHHPYFYEVQRVGMWLRISCCSLIYKKSLRLSNSALGQTTTGHIVNLLSNDVVRFDQATLFLPFLWVGPLQAVAVLFILWYKLGPASLAGFTVLLLLIPLQGWMGRLFSTLRRKTAVETDERVRLMNEILMGMRVIKLYCWEKMFGDLISSVRNQEVKRIRASSYARASIQAPFFSSAKLIALLTFITYSLTGNVMTAETVFVVIGMYNPVRLTMTLFVPFAVQMLTEASITVKRLQNFLSQEELEDSGILRSPTRPSPMDCKVTALNIVAAWDKTTGTLTLNNISFEVRPGELLAVIGPVGAGKSSLLMALLGELPLVSGSMKTNGRIAYASQLPWVFSASVRQNIVFGGEFDMTRYQRAIKTAALSKDLEMMPDGDQTLIGERGASLSGGQKARVSLARALYYDADIYLLDDPLSAVDATVGKHIFDKCINGVLRSKPRILVTHQLQYLKMADKILILKEGRSMAMGTFDELAEHGIDFAALLKRDSEDNDDSDSQMNGQIDKGDPTGLNSMDSLRMDEIMLSDHVIHEDVHPTHALSKSFDPKAYTSLLSESPDVITKGLRKSRSSRSLFAASRHGYVRSVPSVTQSVENVAQHVGSMISLGTLDADIMPEFVAPIHEEEKRKAGTVSLKVYLQYFHCGAGVCGLILLILLNLAAQISYILSDWWLAHWSTIEEDRQAALLERDMYYDMGFNVTNVTIPSLDINAYIYIYSAITASVFIFGLLRALLIFRILVTSAKTLHGKMFQSVIRCPILFFDTNPVGRILNRFAKDMGLLDETLPLTMFDFIQCALNILAIVLVAGIINPWVFLPTAPLCVLFIIIRRYFLATSRDIKRLEATTRSPVFTHVSASLQGLHTIRAFQAEEQFEKEFHRHQDLHTEAWFLFLATSRWLAVRLDWLCAMFVTAVAMCSVLASENLNGGLVGLTLTYAIGLMGLFQWGVRQSAEVENQMTSVERVLEYANLPPEAPLDSEPDKEPSPSWPVHGIITGEHVSLRYSEGAPLVLKNLTFCIRAQEKVGLVGRTGAGKSSLISTLFRLAEPEGLLQIDGIDIKSIGLHDLRRKISIIPQDPVLFTGSVRKNLDPFLHHSDADLWKALEEVQLKPVIAELTEGLESRVSEGGINFSVGQRQLMCLSRAILRKNKILVIDEATANVDPRTDALIQQTIRQKFKHCTVLTIAHRLHTIMDSDRVMMLSQGQIVEFDEPYTLLQDDQSLFYQMVEQTGKAETERLLDIAREAYLIRNQPDPTSIIPDSRRLHLTSNVELEQNGTVEITSIV